MPSPAVDTMFEQLLQDLPSELEAQARQFRWWRNWGRQCRLESMIRVTLKCYHCHGENIVRNGRTSNNKQRYWCQDCGRRSRENPQPQGYPEERREEILRAYQERSSLRGLQRTFGVSRNTVTHWIKKKSQTCRT
jgi:transposase-like protein